MPTEPPARGPFVRVYGAATVALVGTYAVLLGAVNRAAKGYAR
jgi:hypothetical protein